MSINIPATFKDLAINLQTKSSVQFAKFIKEKWKGPDVQESVFRLFAFLRLIPQFNDYSLTKGNFNKMTIAPTISVAKLLRKNIKDKGDKSDLTLIQLAGTAISKMIITTSKNLTNYGVNNLDILELNSLSKKYENCEIRYCVVVPSKSDLVDKIKNADYTSQDIVNILADKSTIIIDHHDLTNYFTKFKEIHGGTNFENYGFNKKCIYFKFHQELTINKTVQIMAYHKKILWGHIPRSGKSYIMAGLMNKLYLEKKYLRNYLVITTAPSETVGQYLDLFNSSVEFKDYDIITLPEDSDKLDSDYSKVVICSKQFLHLKKDEKEIKKKLATFNFDCLFFDESHFGGTTEKSEDILKTYKSDYQVFITATYQKPTATYNINDAACLLWDLEDNTLAKNITDKSMATRLISKHGPECKRLLQNVNPIDIQNQYKDYPELHIITPELLTDVRDEIKSLIDSNYGFSVESLFMLQHTAKVIKSEFVNEKEVIKFWQYILGIPTKLKHIEVPNHRGLLSRAADTAQRHNMNYYDNTPIILIFLPCNLEKMPISKLSEALRNMIEKNFLEFGCIDINCYANGGQNVKTIIYENYAKAKTNNKKALIVLSGKQASLGISLIECHTVILLNNTTSMDMLYQMMFRSMTEAAGKTCGFVIDLNIQRAITLLTDYSYKVAGANAGMSIHESITSILKQRLITMNYDEFFELNSVKFSEFVSKVVGIWTQPNSIGSVLQRINIKNNLFSQSELFTIGGMLALNKSTVHKINEEIEKLVEDIPKGIEKEVIEIVAPVPESKEVVVKVDQLENINITQQFLIYVIPLLCLLSIDLDSSSLDTIMNFIKKNKSRDECLLHQLQVFYPNILPANVLKVFMLIYDRGIKNNKSNEEMILRLKELFSLHLKDRAKLGELIDKYLIPHDNERRKNAEVSTPYSLRQEMLDSITKYGDVNFWKNQHTVFEPCCGKGGFVVDIIDRYMTGLAENIANAEDRYRYIVEHCIYFADINPLNIFITRLLVDPFGKYKLNYFQGDTLKIDIQREFKLDGFDLVVGNPPYNDSQNNLGKKGGGDSLWNKFVVVSIDKWLKKDQYLVYVHPAGWRKPESDKSKYADLFKLMTLENQMLYLEIHNTKDGQKVFKCGTRYDWYIIQKKLANKQSVVCNEIGQVDKYKLYEMKWLPNKSINEILGLLCKQGENNCEVIYSRNSYGSDKTYISSIKNKIYKHPLIHSTPKSGIRYMYSSRNDLGHFKIPKVIFGESGINHVIIDIEGKYGMTQGTIAIKVENIEEASNISKALLSKKFQEIIQACLFGNFRIDWRLFTYFKKDFWREFI